MRLLPPRRYRHIIAGLAAGTALGTGLVALIAPPAIRAAATSAITLQVARDTGFATRCTESREERHSWFDVDTPVNCTVAADIIPMHASASDCGGQNLNAIAYTTTLYGRSVIVYTRAAGEAIRRHEERHRQQPALALTSITDRVVYRTFTEADARVAVIVSAYQDGLQTGDWQVWDFANQNDSAMVRVFDRLLAADAQSQQALREGRPPAARIMRLTAMAYLFSDSAQNYLLNGYAQDYPTMFAALGGAQPLTLTPQRLAEALQLGGIAYLYDSAAERRDNPLNRWVLYRTLGVGLGPAEQQQAASEGLTATDLAVADARLISTARCPTAQAAAADSGGTPALNPRLEALAFRAAGLAAFRTEITRGPLAEPLGGAISPAAQRPAKPLSLGAQTAAAERQQK